MGLDGSRLRLRPGAPGVNPQSSLDFFSPTIKRHEDERRMNPE